MELCCTFRHWYHSLLSYLLPAMPKACGTRARVVVFTQGADSTIVASEGAVHEFPVDALSKSEVVDTNGEGLLTCWLFTR